MDDLNQNKEYLELTKEYKEIFEKSIYQTYEEIDEEEDEKSKKIYVKEGRVISVKPQNIKHNINFQELMVFAVEIYGIDIGKRIGIISIALKVIAKVFEKMPIDLKDKEARIVNILIDFKNGATIKEIIDKYYELYDTKITEFLLSDYIKNLKKINVIKEVKNKFVLIEKCKLKNGKLI